MGRRRRDAQVIDVSPRRPAARQDDPPPPAAELESPADEYFEDADVAARLVELAGENTEAKIKVYKSEKNKRDAWCFDCSPAEFSESFLRDEYGPGTYRIRMYGDTATGYGLLANRLLEIAPPARRPLVSSQHQQAAATPGAGGENVIIAALQESTRAQLAGLAQLVTAIQSSGQNRQAMLAEMKLMADLFRPAPGTASSAPDTLTQFASFARIMKDIGGGNAESMDPEAAPYTLMGKGLEAFMEFIRMNKSAAPANAAALAAPAPAPASAPALAHVQVTTATPDQSEEQMRIMMRAKLAPLLMAAQSNQDAEQWAEIVYNTADDAAIDMLALDNWHEFLCEIEPAFKDHRAWLDKVRAFILQWAKEDAEQEDAANRGLEPNPARSANVEQNLTGVAEPGTSPGNAPGTAA